jgi:hypothetical protein
MAVESVSIWKLAYKGSKQGKDQITDQMTDKTKKKDTIS